MIVLATDQRTDAWRLARVGRLTGSRAGDMLATIKKGEAAARRDYRLQLVCERLTGVSQESGYVNRDMQRGIDKEPDAIALYEAVTGRLVKSVGFLAHDTLLAGCSPDGVIGNYTGIVEAKCPRTAAHIEALKSRRLPEDYVGQVTHNLWITGASWCDFVSFDDRLPLHLRLAIVRVHRNDAEIASYELLARQFLADVDRELADVQNLDTLVAA